MNKEITRLIEESKKEYNKKSQRAALLARNKKFRKELKEIPASLGKDFFKMPERLSIKIGNGLPPPYSRSFWDKLQKWLAYCDRWHIHPDWNGQLDSLAKYMGDPVGITIRPNFERALGGFISLSVDAWTTLDDVRKIWPKVEKYQKEYLAHKVEKKSNFGRDLCWYDLNKKFKLSYRQIAKLWVEKHSENIELIIIRKIKKDKIIMEEIKDAIEKEEELKELKGRVLKDQEFLREVKSGKLAKKFKNYFDSEREFYISGKTNRGKFTPPLLNTIKQAVKRMEKYINQMSLNREFYYKKFGLIDEPFEPLD